MVTGGPVVDKWRVRVMPHKSLRGEGGRIRRFRQTVEMTLRAPTRAAAAPVTRPARRDHHLHGRVAAQDLLQDRQAAEMVPGIAEPGMKHAVEVEEEPDHLPLDSRPILRDHAAPACEADALTGWKRRG